MVQETDELTDSFMMQAIALNLKWSKTDPRSRRAALIERYSRLLNERAEREVESETRYGGLCQAAYRDLREIDKYSCVVYSGVKYDTARPRDEQAAFLFKVLTEGGWEQRWFHIFTGGTRPVFCY